MHTWENNPNSCREMSVIYTWLGNISRFCLFILINTSTWIESVLSVIWLIKLSFGYASMEENGICKKQCGMQYSDIIMIIILYRIAVKLTSRWNSFNGDNDCPQWTIQHTLISNGRINSYRINRPLDKYFLLRCDTSRLFPRNIYFYRLF